MIDWNEFHAFFNQFGPNMAVELIDVFAIDHLEDMEQIDLGINNKDFAKIRFHAHRLKSSIGAFRDAETANIAERLEKLGELKIETGIAETFEELKPEVNSLLQELLDYKEKTTS